MGILDIFTGGIEADDVNVLPIPFIHIYLNPHRALGLDEASTNVNLLRETFRKLCLGFIPSFSGLGEPKMTLRQGLLAYHLVRGTLKGPAIKLKEILEDKESQYFDFRPDDILPVLRPRDWEAFREIFQELSNEMISMPSFPQGSLFQTVGVSRVSRESSGELLAAFVIRVHQMFASKGTFSPRLFNFLGIDFQKVQSEEEGAILAILDTPNRPYQTVWHLIDEKWLIRWRRFAMGRGARRYIPPGRITNRGLLAESKKEGKKELRIGIHYRAVNYNVWRFYELVHGGGPVISRIDQNIYSEMACSLLQACIKIQTLIRMFLAMVHKEKLYIRYLSMRQAGKGVILEVASQDLKKKIEKILKAEQAARTSHRLRDAVLFSQSNWRKKKNYVAATNLEKLKEDQDIFARSKGFQPSNLDVATGNEGLVVQEVLPIVHIGSTLLCTRTLTEDDGKIPFQVYQLPATETAVIIKSNNPLVFVDGSKIVSINENPTIAMTYEEVKKKLASSDWPLVLGLETPLRPEQKPTVHSLLSLNDRDLRYNVVKMLLTMGIPLIKHNRGMMGRSSKHLTLFRISDKEFFYTSRSDPSKPEGEKCNKHSLFAIKFIREGAVSDDVCALRKVQPAHCFEIITNSRGIIFEIPSPERLDRFEAKAKQKILRSRPKNGPEEDPKTVIAALNTERTVAENNRRDKETAVNVQTEKYPQLRDGEYVDDELYHSLLCSVFVDMLKELVREIRASQIYVDPTGIITMRETAKTALRKVDKTV